MWKKKLIRGTSAVALFEKLTVSKPGELNRFKLRLDRLIFRLSFQFKNSEHSIVSALYSSREVFDLANSSAFSLSKI